MREECRPPGRPRRSAAPRRRHQRPSRGCGRAGLSVSSPPTPMAAISARPTGKPASTRHSTKSKPLSLGERAQPGRPSTVRPSKRARHQQIAGIDRHAEDRRSVPPARSSAAGITSRRSVMALAPNTRMGSAPAAAAARDGLRHARRSHGPRGARTRWRSRAARSLASSASRFLSRSAGFHPGRRVEISATRLRRNGATRIGGLVAATVARLPPRWFRARRKE